MRNALIVTKLDKAALAQRLHEAASNIPKDEICWRKQRDEWKAALSRSARHTSSTKLVGLTIADRTINRNPRHKNFRLGWASIEKLSEWTGTSARTISTALAELEADGWIALKRGTGPGNSNKYTLALDRVGDSNFSEDQRSEDENPQKLREFVSANPKPENPEQNTRKLLRPNMQVLPANPNRNPTKPLRPKVTAQDHFQIATALGHGDVQRGYELLGTAAPEYLERLAISLRENNATDEQIRVAFAPAVGPP